MRIASIPKLNGMLRLYSSMLTGFSRPEKALPSNSFLTNISTVYLRGEIYVSQLTHGSSVPRLTGTPHKSSAGATNKLVKATADSSLGTAADRNNPIDIAQNEFIVIAKKKMKNLPASISSPIEKYTIIANIAAYVDSKGISTNEFEIAYGIRP